MFHFYFQVPNLADCISAGGTIIGIVLAVYALVHWRKQKEWDVIMDAVAHAKQAYRMVIYSYGEIPAEPEIATDFPEYFDYQAKQISRNNDLQNRIRIINSKINFTLKNKHRIVGEYYNLLINLLDNLEEIEIRKIEERILNEFKNDEETIRFFEEKYKDNIVFEQIPEDIVEHLKGLQNKVSDYKVSRWWYFF